MRLVCPLEEARRDDDPELGGEPGHVAHGSALPGRRREGEALRVPILHPEELCREELLEQHDVRASLRRLSLSTRRGALQSGVTFSRRLTPREMESRRRSVGDEVHGLRAVSAIVAVNLEDAVDELGQVSARNLAGFELRFALVAPRVAVHLGWRPMSERMRTLLE